MSAGGRERFGGEEGAVAVLAAAFLAIALAATALAVDFGAGVAEHRELRKVADLAALDAVLAVGERREEFADPQDGAALLAQRSVARNGLDLDSGSLEVAVGNWDEEARRFTPSGSPLNAVRVRVGERVEWRFAPGGRELEAEAVASVDDVAGIAIGSGLATFDSRDAELLDAVLSEMLEAELGLSAVHYTGLADARIRLGRLASELDLRLASPDELAASQVTVLDVARATLTVAQEGGEGAAEVEALGRIVDVLTASAGGASFALGQVLDLSVTDGRSAASAELNVLTLLTAAAQAANGENGLVVDLDADLVQLDELGTVTGVQLRLAVIEPPRIAVGPARQVDGRWATVARTAQVRLTVETDVEVDPALLGSLAATTMRVPVYVGAAEGVAALTAAECAGDPAAASLTVDTTTAGGQVRLVEATDGQLAGGTHPSGPAHLVELGASLLGLAVPVADVYGDGSASLANGAGTLGFTGPFSWENTRTISGTSDPAAALTAAVDVRAELLREGLSSSLLDEVSFVVTSVLRPLTVSVAAEAHDGIASQVLRHLGAELSVADVTAWHQDCAQRRLVD